MPRSTLPGASLADIPGVQLIYAIDNSLEAIAAAIAERDAALDAGVPLPVVIIPGDSPFPVAGVQ